MQRALTALRRDGHTQALQDEFVSMAGRDRIVRTDEYLNLGRERHPL